MGIEKILITGCGGMLGSAIYPELRELYEVMATDINLNEPWLSHLDIRSPSEAKRVIDKFNPDIVLHLGALTSLEFSQENPQEAYSTNYKGTENIAKITQEKDIPLVYISTAGVFDGKKRSYTEGDSPNPINVYGMTKFFGEIAVENINPRHFITRAGWMIGGARKDHKFVSYIINQALAGKKEIYAVNDKFGTPTYTRDFARNLRELFNTENYGRYHMVCEGEASRADIAREILINIESDAIVTEVSSDYFERQFPVARPTSEILKNKRLREIGLMHMRDWKDALRDYIRTDWIEAHEQRE